MFLLRNKDRSSSGLFPYIKTYDSSDVPLAEN